MCRPISCHSKCRKALMALNRSDKSRILRRYFPGMTRNSEMSTEPRNASANFDGQMRFEEDRYGSLLALPCPVVTESEGSIYGIVIYSSSRGNSFELGYIGIGFLDHESKRYIGKLDLTNLRPDPAARTEAEQIEDLLNLQILTETDPVPVDQTDGQDRGRG